MKRSDYTFVTMLFLGAMGLVSLACLGMAGLVTFLLFML